MSLLRIAHRGNTKDFTENTYEALASAFEKGIDGVEFDVQLSADHQLVLFHDDSLERLLNVDRPLYDFNYDELAELRFKKGEKIPLLTEVLPLLDKGSFYLEVKIPEAKKDDDNYLDLICKLVSETLNQQAKNKRFCTVGSFHPGVLKRLAENEPPSPWPLTGICERISPCPKDKFLQAEYYSVEYGMGVDFPSHTFIWGPDPIEHEECLQLPLMGLVSDHWF